MSPNLISIKAIGAWNPQIFNPSWLERFILSDIESETKLSGVNVNIDERSFLFDINKVVLSVFINLLELKCEKDYINDERIKLLSKLFLKITSLLPHTPIQAVGYNFNYKLPIGSINLENPVFDKFCEIIHKKEEYDLNVKQLRLTKEFKNNILNVTLEMEQNLMKVNFNYHFVKFDLFTEDLIFNLIEDTKLYLKST